MRALRIRMLTLAAVAASITGCPSFDRGDYALSTGVGDAGHGSPQDASSGGAREPHDAGSKGGGASASGGAASVGGGTSGAGGFANTGGASGSGGTQSAGGIAGTGGTLNTGGISTGGAGGTLNTGSTSGTGGTSGATGSGGAAGTGGAVTDASRGCSAPYTNQLTTALLAALPDKVTWTAFYSSVSGPSCYEYAACGPLGGSTPTPNCGTLSIQWTSASVLPSGDVYVSFAAQVTTAAKYGCSGAIVSNCSISASTTAGTLKIHFQNTAGPPALAWTLSAPQSLATWSATSTCPHFDATAAGADLNAELTAAIPLTLAASCP